MKKILSFVISGNLELARRMFKGQINVVRGSRRRRRRGRRGWCGHQSHWWEYFNGAITGLTRTSLLPCLLMTRVSHFSLNILFQCLPLYFSLWSPLLPSDWLFLLPKREHCATIGQFITWEKCLLFQASPCLLILLTFYDAKRLPGSLGS